MINPPSNWNTFWSLEDTVLEVDINVNYEKQEKTSLYSSGHIPYTPGSLYTIDFTNEDLTSEGVTVEHMSSDGKTVGNVNAAMITFTLVNPGENGEFLREDEQLSLYVRLSNPNYQYPTNWVLQGTFYIESISRNDDGSVSIVGYDAVYILADVLAPNIYSTFGAMFNRSGVIGGIGRNSPAATDPRIANYAYDSDYMAKSPSAKDACSVAAIYAGADMIVNKKQTELELVDIGNNVSVTDEPLGYVVSAESVNSAKEPTLVTGVRVESGNNTYDYLYSANLAVEYPEEQNPSVELATTIYNNMLAKNNGRVLVCGTELQGAVITPLLEIGDMVSVLQEDGTYFNFRLHGYRIQYAGYCYGELNGGIDEKNLMDFFSSSTAWKLIIASSQSPTVKTVGDRLIEINAIVFNNDVVSPSSPPYPTLAYLLFGYGLRFNATCLMEDGTTQTMLIQAQQMTRFFPLYDSNSSPQSGIASNRYYVKEIRFVSRDSLSNVQEIISTDLAIESGSTYNKMITNVNIPRN